MEAPAATMQPRDTVGELVETATAVLAAAGIRTARLDAEVLLAHACGMARSGLYASWRETVPANSGARFTAMLARRQACEPLQYIVGRQEFWSLDFAVTPDVLIPRPETELLVEAALQALSEAFGDTVRRAKTPNRITVPTCHARSLQAGIQDGVGSGFPLENCGNDEKSALLDTPQICDLGTGSGCIAVALARELPRAEVWALDVSTAALAVATANARRHGVAGRIRFTTSDLFDAVRDRRFDVIVCNPPYVRTDELERAQPELAWEPRRALDGGGAGLAVVERVVAQSRARLTDGGWLIMEIGAEQAPAVEALARAANFRSVCVRPDYAGLPRALVAQR